MEQLIVDFDQDPTSITQDLGLRDIRRAADHLEGTYIIRLFAEFETGLRSYWFSKRKKKTATRAEVLVDSIGRKHEIQNDLISSVHVVRKYRNTLIHEREADSEVISLPIARAHLCKFFAWLPSTWP
jgi:hypothetical protein